MRQVERVDGESGPGGSGSPSSVRDGPATGPVAAPHPPALACPACGAPGDTPYCGACGRRRATRVPPVRDLVGELFRELGGIERRSLRTAALLLFRPGRLTEEYREGRGARYVSPVRIYLVASALYFLSGPVAGDRLSIGWIHVVSDTGFVAPAVFALLTVPILATVLFVVFRRARRPWAEHLVAAFHMQSVLFVLWAVAGGFAGPEGLERPPLWRLASVGLAIAWVGGAARRLWTRGRATAWLGGVVALVTYSLLTGAAVMAAYWMVLKLGGALGLVG